MADDGHHYRSIGWNQLLVVAPNGDTRSFICVRSIADKDGLNFFRLRVGANECVTRRQQK
ncbi:hypothetical protein [Umezawaea beigongshangensis]|uniref:hypothetical protein n=1 Tax=Umezawaea beigongshangensis TaxID=2780383 RepID=UPI0018F1D7D3|nr:hypothetical protein [Umezawaea beigongshangensis]